MNTRRWWDVAVAAVIVALCAVAVLDADSSNVEQWTLLGLLGALGVLYGTLLRRWVPLHVGINDDEPSVAVALMGQLPMIALAAAAVALNPNMMNTMVIVLPLLWLSSAGTLHAIVVNVVATTALGVGYAFNQGWTATGSLTALAISGISTAFSIALGLWISSIADWGTERSRLLAELTEAQGALEAAHRESGAAFERERIARDIHDTIAQSLTSIVMLAERASREPDARGTIALVEDTARDALSDARALVAANATVSTQLAPLEASLTRLGERFARETGVAVSSSVDLGDQLPRELEVMLLRCVQEGLANVRKHADAHAVSVTLRSTVAGVELTVTDDGRGLRGVTVDDERGFGLTGMRERVALVGGSLSVMDAAPGGVTLAVTVPHSPVPSNGATP
ncbi:sensor histidine kinase [Paramicrobacterium agarici]|uniref:Signal transduction histidine kinase n=1 Tax=Paramicrobacterium agarici TaxID=630514 RepID=A0A2A9DS75_9MICO|nr:sensor histidine kinase [Microbacterium agarici]PFG29528.1 signal transduction histidine kinase [Microbacterium agarici]